VSEQFIQPLVEAAKPTTGQRIGSGISDAIQGFLATKFGRSQGPSAIEGVRARNQAEADRINQQNLLKAQVELRDKAEQTRLRERDEDIARGEAEGELSFSRKLELLGLERDENKRKEGVAALEHEKNRAFQLKRDASRNDPRDAKLFDQQQQALLEARGGIIAVKRGLAAKLEAQTPDEIREELSDDLFAQGLSGDALEMAMVWVERFVEPGLRKFEEQQAAKVSQRVPFPLDLSRGLEEIASRVNFDVGPITDAPSTPFEEIFRPPAGSRQ
jgi:hypothetical protein